MSERFNNAVGPQARAGKPRSSAWVPVLLSLAVGMQAATQLLAHDFQYQRVLGAHFHRFYPRWASVQWAAQWCDRYPDAFLRAAGLGTTVASAGLLALAVVRRPLLTPDECLRMPGLKKKAQGQVTEAGDMLVYVTGCPAIYGRQPLYFQDATFAARAAVPEPVGRDVLRPVSERFADGGIR